MTSCAPRQSPHDQPPGAAQALAKEPPKRSALTIPSSSLSTCARTGRICNQSSAQVSCCKQQPNSTHGQRNCAVKLPVNVLYPTHPPTCPPTQPTLSHRPDCARPTVPGRFDWWARASRSSFRGSCSGRALIVLLRLGGLSESRGGVPCARPALKRTPKHKRSGRSEARGSETPRDQRNHWSRSPRRSPMGRNDWVGPKARSGVVRGRRIPENRGLFHCSR